jgi:hypothetical protein
MRTSAIVRFRPSVTRGGAPHAGASSWCPGRPGLMLPQFHTDLAVVHAIDLLDQPQYLRTAVDCPVLISPRRTVCRSAGLRPTRRVAVARGGDAPRVVHAGRGPPVTQSPPRPSTAGRTRRVRPRTRWIMGHGSKPMRAHQQHPSAASWPWRTMDPLMISHLSGKILRRAGLSVVHLSIGSFAGGKSRNEDVREHFNYGFGIHHAGMLRPDRPLH